MNEKYIEQQLIKAVKKRNGLALKLYSPSYIGIPDRLVLIAFGHIGFVEVKAPKKMPRPIQLKRHEEEKMEFQPHEYQNYAINFIENHLESALILDVGLGKTIITLTAINDLLFDSFEAHKVLIVAPIRVCINTWVNEIKKWDHLKELKYSLCIGDEKTRKRALSERSDIYIINRENVEWLIEKSKVWFDFDTIVLDELSSFKNGKSKRFKALNKVRPLVKRIIGLTATPSSNGLMDLWAEYKLLDKGKRLGRFISNYRQSFFEPDKRNQEIVFSYKPLPWAKKAIYKLIEDITISMKSIDHLKMPRLIINDYPVVLSEKEFEIYDAIRQNFVLEFEDKDITIANSNCKWWYLQK